MTPFALLVSLALTADPIDECPSGRRVTFDAPAAKRAFKSASTAKELEPLLRALTLQTAAAASSCVEHEPAKAELDVFKAALFSGAKRDLLVQARGWMCGQKLLDGVVLRPTSGGSGEFCAFRLPFFPGLLDMEPLHAHTLTFGFVNLTDSKRQTVRVNSHQSVRGTGLYEDESVSFFDFDPATGAIRELFRLESTSGRGGYTSESKTMDFEVSVVEDAAFPWRLKVEERGTTCPGPYEEVETPSGTEVVPSTAACTTVSEKYLACLQGARYERCK